VSFFKFQSEVTRIFNVCNAIIKVGVGLFFSSVVVELNDSFVSIPPYHPQDFSVASDLIFIAFLFSSHVHPMHPLLILVLSVDFHEETLLLVNYNLLPRCPVTPP